MPPQTPLLIVDNVFDAFNLYPNAVVVGSGTEVPGKEAFHVADYRRDRTFWSPAAAAANNYVYSDLGVGAAKVVDTLFIDRGHNLWGKQVTAAADDGSGGSTTSQTFTVPALGTVGGDPVSGTFVVTEEGALYQFLGFGPTAFRRRFIVYVVDNMVPIITGIIMGARTQLLGYSTTFDEDAGERIESSETSRAGYRGQGLTYSWRTVEIGLGYIGATEYDGTVRALRRTLFEKNQPFVCFMDYGTRPERGWMYQYDGSTWGLPKSRVYRSGRLRARELGASLG